MDHTYRGSIVLYKTGNIHIDLANYQHIYHLYSTNTLSEAKYLIIYHTVSTQYSWWGRH